MLVLHYTPRNFSALLKGIRHYSNGNQCLLASTLSKKKKLMNPVPFQALQIVCIQLRHLRTKGSNKEGDQNESKALSSDHKKLADELICQINNMKEIDKKILEMIDSERIKFFMALFTKLYEKGQDEFLKFVKSVALFAMAFSLGMLLFLFFYMLSKISSHKEQQQFKSYLSEGTQVSFNELVQKYLSSGEVAKLTYMPIEKKALAVLHPRAIIDGQPVSNNALIIDVPSGIVSPEHFVHEIRNAEQAIGIHPFIHGVEIASVAEPPSLLIRLLIILYTFLIDEYTFTAKSRTLYWDRNRHQNQSKLNS